MTFEHQHISIGNYFNDKGHFRDLGGHLSRCEKPELTIMNSKAEYPAQARSGMKALTTEATAHDILKLAKALHGYDTLWEGAKAGFDDGLKERLAASRDNTDLVRLAVGTKAYPELYEILQKGLTSEGAVLTIKKVESHWHHNVQVVSLQRPNQEPQVFVAQGNHVTRAENLGRQDQDLQQMAAAAFPPPQRG